MSRIPEGQEPWVLALLPIAILLGLLFLGSCLPYVVLVIVFVIWFISMDHLGKWLCSRPIQSRRETVTAEKIAAHSQRPRGGLIIVDDDDLDDEDER